MSRATDWVPAWWLDTFSELLNEDNELDYGDQWTLNFNYRQTNTVTNEERKRGWKVFCHYTHANFRCGSCSKTWPSARVLVLFRYRLQKNRGTAVMRPFGQTCRSCESDEFELPGFSLEEVKHALLRLFSKIKKNCYGEADEYEGVGSSDIKKTKPHEKTLCEACKMGICAQDEESCSQDDD
uniref:3CxxC-type domain-containing protein n=1 Tax=Scophthalmus maximus TaxID=52904 RepID=A0A8D3DW10_SCOMX